MKSSVNDSVVIRVSRHAISSLSMRELDTFLAAVTAANDAINGVLNQPRCGGDVYRQVEAFQDGFNKIIDLAIGVGKEATPATLDEAEERAFVLIHHQAGLRDDFQSIGNLVDQMRRDMEPFMKGATE
ncbi:hypothetical protein [Rhizobium sp. YK2]|uniref:hypothetical protein n=1 Tax=Rhizobium sp. YK2 TaxID=1860096 RepID=UPI00084C5F07|nr:hypothetical protein [Rhizobium sp. YK2]OEC94407.1 hypothetical protein A9Z06_33425 [Rhizobium sp. YK2]